MMTRNLLRVGVRCVQLLAIVTVALAMIARAQSPAPCATPVALGAMFSYGNVSKVNAPYSATATTKQENKLADGSVVHTSVTTHEARDSAGRRRVETSLGCQPGPDGERHPVVRIGVSNPATGTSTSWTPDDPAKVYRVIKIPVLTTVAKPETGMDIRQDAAGRHALASMGIRTEDLGSKSIAGVIADGTRFIHKIPAGVGGKDQPSENVSEIWVARGLGLWMLRIVENPIDGRTTTEVVDLKQGEPDASLFAPPAGYKLEEQGAKPVTTAGAQ